ncbi:mRNA decay activator protein ZFP36 [Ambystoma mexicanum]|uniref:mRNA decay activator protein ZFP36 n=1 Tax=Ambystoma mexicanum TaxID=8296 RepID=UPI0037E7C3AA
MSSIMLDINSLLENLRNLNMDEPELITERSNTNYQRRHSTCATNPSPSKCGSAHQLSDSLWPLSSHWSPETELKMSNKVDSIIRNPFRADRSMSLTESALSAYGMEKTLVPPPPGFPPLKPAMPVLSNRYKTELCRTFTDTGKCKYGAKCQFAHGLEELRVMNRHPKYKTELCHKYYLYGDCPYGPRCNFIHYPQEIGSPQSWAADPPHQLRQSLSYSGVPGRRSSPPPGIPDPNSFARASSVSPPPTDLFSPTLVEPRSHGSSLRLNADPPRHLTSLTESTCCSCRCGRAVPPVSTPSVLPSPPQSHHFFGPQGLARTPSSNSLSDPDCYSSSSSLSGSESPVFELTGSSYAPSAKRLPIFNRLSVSDQ